PGPDAQSYPVSFAYSGFAVLGVFSLAADDLPKSGVNRNAAGDVVLGESRPDDQLALAPINILEGEDRQFSLAKPGCKIAIPHITPWLRTFRQEPLDFIRG